MNARWQDTPAAVFLRLLADLMVVNVLTILCSVPIVTLGASFSAMYAVLFQRERDEGSVAVLKTFFQAFKRNFWKATLLGLILVIIALFALGDFLFAMGTEGVLRSVYTVVGTIVAIVFMILFLLALPQQAVYQNTIGGYLKNSLLLAVCAPLQLLAAIASWVIPWALAFAIPEILIRFGVIYLVWGIAFPAWATSKLLSKVFAKIEQNNS